MGISSTSGSNPNYDSNQYANLSVLSNKVMTLSRDLIKLSQCINTLQINSNCADGTKCCNLQETTDEGNSTSRSIYSTSSIEVRDTNANSLSGLIQRYAGGALSLKDRNNSNRVFIASENITDNRTLLAPDADGVLALKILLNDSEYVPDSTGSINLGYIETTVPSLEEVCNVGNTFGGLTLNTDSLEIFANDSLATINSNFIQVSVPASENGGFSILDSNFNEVKVYIDNQVPTIRWGKDSAYIALRADNTQSGDGFFVQLPRSDETLVTTVNGVTADDEGVVSFGFTAGSVLFATTDGNITQDNANIFFDNTNNRLGLLTNSPDATFTINGGSQRIHNGGITIGNGSLLVSRETSPHPAIGVSIETVVDPGWSRGIKIRQSEPSINLLNGNADGGGGGIARPQLNFGANEGELRIFSNNVTTETVNQSYITFYTGGSGGYVSTGGSSKGRIDESGLRYFIYPSLDHNPTAVSNDIPSGGFGVYKNTSTGEIKLWARDGSTMYDLTSGSGGGSGTTTNALTIDASGLGDSAGSSFNGSSAKTISYNSIGAQPTLVSGTNIKTINGVSILGSGNIVISGSGSGTVNSGTANRLSYYASTGTSVSQLAAITANRALVSDANGLPVASSVSSTTLGFLDATSSIQTQLNSKQAALVSGTNIKTINGNSILGSGNITISGSGSGTINSGTGNRLAYYPSTGTTVDDIAAITPNKVLISDTNGLPIASSVSNTTLAFLDATSSIQTQINNLVENYAYYTIAFSTNFIFNGNNGINQKIVLSNNATLSFSNMTVGKFYYLTIKQNGTGGWAVTFPSNTLFPLGASSSGHVLNNTTTANAEDDIAIRYDGTNYRIYLSKDMGV